MASKIPDTVCSAPWMHFALGSHPDGKIVTPCCRFSSKGNKYKFQNPAIATSRQGYFEGIRKKMLAGQRIIECEKCWVQEKNNRFSMRHQMLRKMSLREIADQQHKDEPFELRYIELMFTNLCNLSCRMCDVTQSSQWASLYNNAFVPNGIKDEFVMSEQFLDAQGKAHTQPIPFDWKLLEGVDLSNLTTVKILGGEPMMSPEHLEFLTKLMEKSKDPSKIELIYHTNGTKRPSEKVVDYWRQMKKIEIVFSIDGYGKVNEYQRIGSDWNILEENIKWYAGLGIDFDFRLHTVLSILTIWQFDRLCDWAENKFKKIIGLSANIPGLFYPDHKVITIDFVQRPNYLDLRIMPDELKQKCSEIINSSDHLDEETKNSILAYFGNSQYNNTCWKDFWTRMIAIDKYTKLDLNNVAPQLLEYKI